MKKSKPRRRAAGRADARRPASKRQQQPQAKGMAQKKRATVRDMPWISVTDMAQALGVCTFTVYRYIWAGIIEATKPDTPGGRGRWKIDRKFALDFISGVESHSLAPMARPKRGKAPPLPSVDPRQLPLYR